MISGIALLLATTLSANPPPAAADTAAADQPSAAAPAAADQLVARLARPVPAHTTYTEVRFVHLLKKPLVLHGELDYGGAGKLGKSVTAPYREMLHVDGDAVTLAREGNGERHFPLDRAPELHALLAGFSALLSGDAAALRQHFDVALAQDGRHWTLTLTPTEAGLAKHLKRMLVDGAGNEPACFALDESNGDASVMRVGAHAAAPLPQAPTRAALEAACRALQ